MVRNVKGANTPPSSLGESAGSIDTPSEDSDPDDSLIAQASYVAHPAEGHSAATPYRYLKPARSKDVTVSLSPDISSIIASIETSADLDTSSGLIRFDEPSTGYDSGRHAMVSLRCLTGHGFTLQRLILFQGSHLNTTQPAGQDSQAPLSENERDFFLPEAASSFGQALPRALDLMPASLPEPSNPPSNQDWKTYRETITKLYATEAKSLKETREILKARYCFQAT